MRKCAFTTAITILCLFVGFGMASAADTFKIGGLVPITGTQAVMAEDLATGLKLAEEEVNAAGGVLGKPIKVIIEDTETRPAPGIDAARKLIDVDKVSGNQGGNKGSTFDSFMYCSDQFGGGRMFQDETGSAGFEGIRRISCVRMHG